MKWLFVVAGREGQIQEIPVSEYIYPHKITLEKARDLVQTDLAPGWYIKSVKNMEDNGNV